jgi:protein involved in polysaccharide export with SLBB domain
MNDPGVAKNYFLQSNDYIHIPVAQKVVEIEGAIIRPMAYELLDNENLTHLIRYAGGAKPNAYLSDVQVTRYLDDRKIITNVNLRDLSASGGDYILLNGDVVEIKLIEEKPENFVTVSGAVVFPGDYERSAGMRISDLIRKSILKPEARLDFGYLLNYQPDGTYRYERVNLEDVLNNPSSAANLELTDQDILEVMTLKTFADIGFFSVMGAVRNPDTFAFNPEGRLKLEDALLLAGGPMIDASDFGYIMRFDPREPKTIEYIHFNVREALENPSSPANSDIRAGDQIYVFDKAGRRDDLTVSIFGAVRNPGTFVYGPGMRLIDIISLAGGFSFEADNQRIDIARSEFSAKQNIKITQFTTQLPRDFEALDLRDGGMLLKPYDHIYVRTIPEFELQQTVRIEGEVKTGPRVAFAILAAQKHLERNLES